MRNALFTIYSGNELELTKNPNGDFLLIFRGINPPDKTFLLKIINPPIYNKAVKKQDIKNAFSVETFANYKNHKFQVDRFQNGKYRLSTSDENLFKLLNLHMVDRGWYDIEVPREQIEKMWEERKPSGYEFPFPNGLKEMEEIDF